MAARAVHVGVRVCLASDSARRGVVESKVGNVYWAVRFADTSRNFRANDLEVLPSDDATFEPSQAPSSAHERQKEERATTIMAARAVQVGARVCLARDSARRGVVESQVAGGCWAVQFTDTSRNIQINDLVVLPSDDAAFKPSRAPPSWAEKQREKRATTMAGRAVHVGARVCLARDSARRGIVEAQVAGGC
jgi:predicted RecA/RadA family phage recombinase